MNMHLLDELYRESYDFALKESKTAEHRCIEGSDYFKSLLMMQLAQLIVKECAIVAWDGTPEMSFEQRLRMSISHDIKEKFGVQ